MGKDWSMPHRTESCASCGRGFEIGETFRAFLYEAEAGYERRDYCAGCVPPDAVTPLGTWKTRRPQPSVSRARQFDREVTCSFFERLEDPQSPQQLQLRFVLALLLWRKKILKLERTLEAGGREIWEFHAPRNDVLHRVERPTLDEEQLEELSTQLEHLLAGEADNMSDVSTSLATEEPSAD